MISPDKTKYIVIREESVTYSTNIIKKDTILANIAANLSGCLNGEI